MGYLKEGADYFPHDVKAREDMKLKKLRAYYGVRGYGFYFYLLEFIYSNKNYSLDIGDEDTRVLLANEMLIDIDTFNGMLQKCLDTGLFSKDIFEREKRLTSEAIMRRVKALEDKREQKREAKRTQREKEVENVANCRFGVASEIDNVASDENDCRGEQWQTSQATNTQGEESRGEYKESIVEESNLVSKKVSKEKEINSHSAGARAYARESYEEILTRLDFNGNLKKQAFKFIQFQQANKKIVTNDMLEKTMRCVKGAAERRVRYSIPGGFIEQMRADLSPYSEDIENYIYGAIQQALDGQWCELKEPKEFKTAAEWEAQAQEDMKLWR
jgi:hypothetical protein